MQLNYLEVNGNLEEVTCHGTPAFPMEVYLDDLDLYPNRSIPWHWHKELELVYVLRGAIEFQTGVRSYVLSSGQGGLLPPNMLHMVAPYHHQRGSAYCAVLADPYLLHGLSGGLVEAQCASFITGADVDFFLLDNTCPWHILDPSRVAAQVVSGIGFIGAGTIIFQKQIYSALSG